MERDGLIERTPDPKDGRSSLVSLTPAMRAKLPELRRAMDKGIEAVLDGFSAQESETLLHLLRRLNVNLDRMLEKELGRRDRAASHKSGRGVLGGLALLCYHKHERAKHFASAVAKFVAQAGRFDKYWR